MSSEGLCPARNEVLAQRPEKSRGHDTLVPAARNWGAWRLRGVTARVTPLPVIGLWIQAPDGRGGGTASRGLRAALLWFTCSASEAGGGGRGGGNDFP